MQSEIFETYHFMPSNQRDYIVTLQNLGHFLGFWTNIQLF
jgi:hypothetical protein